jgi:hypothetical protein
MRVFIQFFMLLSVLMIFSSCKKDEQPAKFLATEKLTRGKNLRWYLRTVIENDSDTIAHWIGGSQFRVSSPVYDSAGNVVGSDYDTVAFKAVPENMYSVYGTVETFDFEGEKSEFYWKWRDDSAVELVHFTKAGDSTFFQIEELTDKVLRMKFTSTDSLMPGNVSYIFK